MNDIHSKGQYFTTNKSLQSKVLEFIKNKPKLILEPSIGQGDLVKYITNKCNVTFDMYELDQSIELLEGIDREKVHYGDFIKAVITKKYKTIIGNPPYIKKSSGNLYLEFIEKCFNLLKIKGELIFIVPSDFLKLTSASKLLNTMLKQGTFTHIYHPNDEKLFTNASIDIIIFRYYKWSKQKKKTLYNNQSKYLSNINGTVTFSDTKITNSSIISDYFDVYVGMVTGKESVYKNDTFGNITLLNKKNVRDKYIFIHEFPTSNEELNKYMLENKDILINRKIKKYTEKNWWLWGAPRNQKKIENNIGKKCIYVSNLTRNKEVAFEGKVEYFGGSLLMMIPKKEVDLKKMVKYLNSDTFKENYTFSKRFKIGHRQLCNSSYIFQNT
jgi:adenine-specific DNA-methyltransferase